MDKKIDKKMSWPKGYEPNDDSKNDLTLRPVSYTHLTLPTNREV